MKISEVQAIVKLIFYEKNGAEFEKFVVKIYKLKYNGELIPIKPSGRLGDLGSDGYVLNELVIQVYAPEKVEYEKAIKKLEENIKRVKEHWDFNEYHFILNDKFQGIHPKIVQKISEFDRDEEFEIKIVDSENMFNDILDLYKSKPFEMYIILNKDAEIENFDDFENLSAVIDFLSAQKDIKNSSVSFYNFSQVPFYQGKEDKITVNIKEKELYKKMVEIVTQSRKIIPKYKEYLEERLAEAGDYIKEIYHRFNEHYSPEESIKLLMNSLIDDLKNSGNFDKNRELALFVVVGHFFDICDIGENPNGNGR